MRARGTRSAALATLGVLAFVAGCHDTTPSTAPRAETPALVAANTKPSAQFAIAPRWPAPGDTVTFDARYSHDIDGQVVRYRWTVSNGVTLTSGAVARTVFRSAGSYSVALTAVDDSTDSTTTSMTLVVGGSGTPSNAVSATQSRLALSAATVAGGGSVTATVTAKTAAGATLSGVLSGVSALGRRIKVSPLTGTGDGSGVWTTSVSASVAQTAIVRGVADFTALQDTTVLTVTPSAAAIASTVRITQLTLTTPSDSVLVEVSAVDTAGNPVVGVPVTISATPAGLVVSNAGNTDANGRRVITVRSSACVVSHVLTITVGGVVLSAAPTIAMTAPVSYGVCGAALWLDASDASTLTTSSSIVTAWRDKSGYARHTAPAAGPLVVAAGLYGINVLRFNGTSQSAPITDVVSGTPYSVFAVARRRSAAAYVLGGSSSSPSQDLHFGWRGSTQATLAHYFNDINGTISAFSSIAAEPGRLLSGRWTSGARSLRLNANTIASDATTSGIGSWPGASIGLLTGAYQSLDVGEVLIFARALTDVERLTVEQALMVKWNLGTIAIAQGDAQTALPAGAVATAPRVRVTDDAGIALAGATVTWQVASGGGAIGTTTTTTDASGYASTSWTLGTASVTQTLTAWYGASGVGQSVTFTATAYGSCAYTVCGTTLWFDASNGASITQISGNLTAWSDLSSWGRHASAGAGPAVVSSNINGRTALQFNGTSQFIPITDVVSGTAYTVLAIARRRTAAVWFLGGSGAGANLNLHLGYAASTTARFSHWFNDLDATVSAFTSTGAEPARAFTGRWTSGARGLFVDGGTAATDAFTSGLTSFAGAALGRRSGAFYNVDIGEVIFYSRALSDVERATAERGLMAKWGIGTMTIAQGNAQSANAGTAPSTDPRVRITDASGAGIPNAAVVFEVTSGGGRVGGSTTASATTDASGYVTPTTGTWILDAGTNALTVWYSSTAGQGQSVVFTGTGTLPSGVTARYDASTASSLTVDGSGYVGQWNDLSGNSRNVTQATLANKPSQVTSAMNGRAAVRFNKDRWLAYTAATANLYTIAAAVRLDTANASTLHTLVAAWANTDFSLRAYNSCWANCGSIDGNDWTFGTGTPMALWVSGVQTTPFSVGVPHTIVASASAQISRTYSLGTSFTANGSNRSLLGLMGEVILFDRALTTGERQVVERYLGWKWGISVP